MSFDKIELNVGSIGVPKQTLLRYMCLIKSGYFQRLNEGERGREYLMVRELAKDDKWGRCPQCKFYVERIEGCPHMVCRGYVQCCGYTKRGCMYKGLRILDVLTGMPRIEVRRMMVRVIKLIPKVCTGKQGGSSGLRARKDAIDIAGDTLQRINSRLKAEDFDQ